MKDFFVDHPKAAMVVSLLLVILGGVSLSTLPITQYPNITPPTVSVSGAYTGADAQTVEESVTTPIESQINGTPGMDYITSNSTNSGAVSINVTFELGTDIDIAALDVQNRVGVAEPTIPEAVRRLGLTVRKRNPSLFMLIALQSPEGTHDRGFIDNYMNIFVRDALLRVDGVGDAFAITKDFSMRLWLNPEKMAALGLTPAEITEALRVQNVQVAAGSVGAPPQNSDQVFEYTVFVDSRLESTKEFEDVIIRNDPATGALIRLSDVGRVELGTFSYGRESLTNGTPAAVLIIYQAPGSNALATADGIVAAMEELKEDFPPDLDYLIPFEGVSVIRASIEEVLITLAIALAIVALIVFIFLQKARATLLPLLAIPASIVGAFILFTPLGFTINTLTLFGLVLAIGIVVDDSIVMVEGIQTNMDEKGMSPAEASKEALRELTTPVITTSLILVAVFLPVAAIPGLTGQLYQQFAVTISISVLLSSLVALTLAPALATTLFKKREENAAPTRMEKIFKPFNNGLNWMKDKYGRIVQWTLGKVWVVALALIAIFAVTWLLFSVEPSGFIPEEDNGRIFITYELPEAAANNRSLEVLKSVMNTLDSMPEVFAYTGVNNLNALTFTTRSNTGTVFVQLKGWDERKGDEQSVNALVGQLNQKLGGIIDARVVVIAPPSIPGLGSSSGFSFVLQDRSGNSTVEEFEQTMDQFLGAVNGRPEIARAFSFFTAQTPGYEMIVDRERAMQLGVPLANVYSTVQTFLGSSYINDFTLYGRTFRVVAQADTMFRTNIQDINDYYVSNTEGTLVPLSNLVRYELKKEAPLISHYNLFRSADISGAAAPGYSSGQAITALQEEAAKLPTGFGYEFSGLSREQANSGNETIYIFGFSILMAFLILVALYESWTVPFSVLVAAPIGIFGSMLTLWLFPGIDNNVYAQIGLITVIGLAAKNAILIVEFAKNKVEIDGMDVKEATVEASRERLRPILMTSATFIFGMIPLALAGGAGAASRQTIGWVVIGGMVAVTFLAVLFVPAVYATITGWAYSEEELASYKKKEEGEEGITKEEE
ncbi:efflux RND transporter permease subunit [Neolewinella antarctica]|uniref:HAE1 family hydrophobic/amphiphilic exporter-1 n=1 Tax=Neolewinella antarctica TaxID=442734 RepID=A0ABX0XDD4_9BACT|nr:efflux RND transporter permease subunit [Neolewinella antarctica]NJC26946.1 HAE1 family hydrophobic/amphiphilic exporter-1 [Neolewinella antarctica]